MNIDLTKKVVLVTGGSRGIGAAAVQHLAQAGATVACQYQRSREAAEKVKSKNPDRIFLFQCDLESAEGAFALVRKVTDQLGRIDVLINNAGMALNSAVSGKDEVWLADWDRTMAVNLRAAAILCREVLPFFTSQGSGVIINVSSRAAHRGDTEDYLAYAASKGGMEALTKSLARAYGKKGIAVFGIAPGFTRTDMAQDFIDTYGEDYASSDIALQQLTEPEDIAPFFVFLSSGLATHATGTTIDVNAGSYVR
ncbi:SDR family NAD(P)-dependent oxidoreductase [Fulvivirga sedimenti]|uniref:SDR family oxidoreductase n=1 Tax=Fulvivirga sedimenti TaxID=2879465 RepID=A0A9X1HKW8_9BACT|nr:SDR family oxidoreductase [Fulvivirga sedimenti]MCA6074139.1 SDR family oxidoreductase [Fulvivirga sedimenti]